MKPPSLIIPRDDLIDEILEHVLKGRHVWLVAPEGYGKTTLLQEAVDELEDAHSKEVIFCTESTQLKPLMLDIAQQLHHNHLFSWEELKGVEISWTRLHTKLDRIGIVGIVPIVLHNLERLSSHQSMNGGKTNLEKMRGDQISEHFDNHHIILVLDALERIGPSSYQHYAKLFDVCTIITASRNFRNPQVKKLHAYARVIEVPKLTAEQANTLSDFLFDFHKIHAYDEEMVKQHIVRASDGIPLKLKKLYEDAETEKVIDNEYIRKLKSKTDKAFVSMGWLLLVMIAVPMALRIVAVGSGDRDGFIAFGVLSAFSVVMLSRTI
jgi:hypothetical protein